MAFGITETLSGLRQARRQVFSLLQISGQSLPGVGDANCVVDVGQGKFQQLVHDDRASVCKAKERMIGEADLVAHRP